MTTVAWWHCFSGIAGDMALASLIDAGAPLAEVERGLEALPVSGWTLEVSEVLRGGVAATLVDVRAEETTVVRTHAHIEGLITEARLPDRVRKRALATFARLAEVEGRLHRTPAAQVHFHEVGGIDAIVDIVGTCLALEALGIDEIRSSPVAQGIGMVRSAHGLLPIPAPATVELLRSAPTYGTEISRELTTPTGAALVASLASGFGAMPSMTITASGYGAGSRDLDGRPNALQVIVGTASNETREDLGGQPVVVLEANLDDVTGEILAHTLASLIDAGAYDAWLTPIVGKKGRPAHVLSALVDPATLGTFREIVIAETGTTGVRSQSLSRWTAVRQMDEVSIEGHRVRVKRSAVRTKAEFDDTVRVGRELSIAPREVAFRAEEAARKQHLPER